VSRKIICFVLYFFHIFLEDDFVCGCDLYLACVILQKQIEHIDGKKENIVISGIKMKQIREQNGEFLRRIFLISTFLFS
jgi:hypothetical protein